jgi:hypothetical protein
MKKQPTTPEWMLQKMIASTAFRENGCWEWIRTRNADGYGELWFAGKLRIVSRVSHELFIAPLVGDQCALHRCDNPPCWNPDHLLAGTRLDNKRDAIRKGRHAYGERMHTAKLTPDAVRFIRSNAGMTDRALAALVGVGHAAVNAIRNGKTWRHVDAT